MLDRQGFTWEVIHELNPRLIYASVKGFGRCPMKIAKSTRTSPSAPAARRARPDSTTARRLVTGAQIGDSGDRHSSRRRNFGGAFPTGKKRPGTASHLRHAGYGAQSLPRQAARSTKTRRGTADGVSHSIRTASSATPVPRAGNASGGGQPGWAVRTQGGGPNDYIYVIIQPPGLGSR